MMVVYWSILLAHFTMLDPIPGIYLDVILLKHDDIFLGIFYFNC